MLRYTVHADQHQGTIQREIYGNFAEHLGRGIYEGIFVGENSPIPNVRGMRCDVVEALRAIRLPVLRWPGGCFADEYHWKDGVGPQEDRKKMINTHWGGVTEDNSFGTHEFFELCEQIGCEPYINGNVGSGTVQEMQEWVEYMTSGATSPMADWRRANGREEPWPLRYFGIGNENWGCGGSMRPSYYADVYRQFQTYVRNYGENRIYKVACGPGCSQEDPGYEWLETVLSIAAHHMDGISMHYYTVLGDWKNKGSATDFTREDYERTLEKAAFIDELLVNAEKILDRYDESGRIGILFDEWGTWFDVEPGTVPGFLYQQNTMRDALVAALTLNSFNKHCGRVRMANIAQMINVLQALMLTEGEKMVLTPTYHVYDLFQCHQGAQLVKSAIEGAPEAARAHENPALWESASVAADGSLSMTLCNPALDHGEIVDISIGGMEFASVQCDVLTGEMGAHNTFEQPAQVGIRPLAFERTDAGLRVTVPAVGVVRITVK